MKKLLSIVLSICLICQLCVPALAAEHDHESEEQIFFGESHTGAGSGAPVIIPKKAEVSAPYAVQPYLADINTSEFVEPVKPVVTDVTYSATTFSAKAKAATLAYTVDIKAAAAILRESMKSREEEIHVYYQVGADVFNISEQTVSDLANRIYEDALAHTGVGTEGDYLRWVIGSVGIVANVTKENDEYNIEFIYSLSYYTTAEQEAELTDAIALLVTRLKLREDVPEIEKIYNIYSYISTTVEYDYTNLDDQGYLLKYTAYAALINKTAICQGYATLLYRLALEADISSRVITGISHGENHAWNIVELNDEYYFMDATWDASSQAAVRWDVTTFDYFMKCSNDFPDHQAEAEYVSAEFLARYPLATSSCHYEPPVLQDGNYCYYAKGGFAYLCKYVGRELDVVVPAVLGGYPVHTITRNAFSSNETMQSLTFSEGIRVLEFEGVFHCTALKSIHIPSTMELKTIFDGVAPIPRLCYQLSTITVSPENEFLVVLDNILYSKDLKKLIMFPAADPRTVVEIPESVAHIGIDAFEYCTNIKEVILSDNIVTIDHGAFINCSGLEKINIPKSCLYIGEAAFAYGNLSRVYIPAAVEIIAARTFMGNPLQEIVVDDNNQIYYVRNNCLIEGEQILAYCTASSSASLTIPDGIRMIGAAAFYGAGNLREVYLPETLEEIFPSAFERCTQLEAVDLPDSVRIIGTNAFLFCKSLQQISLSENLEVVEGFAFSDCSSLKSIAVPAGVSYIGSYAFQACSKLNTIKFCGNAPIISDGTFSNVTADVYYPCGNDTWTSKEMQYYNGYLQWKPMHAPVDSGDITEAKCLEPGFTTHTCSLCGELYQTAYTQPASHIYQNGNCMICGSETIVERGTCGENLFWEFSENGTLTICGTGIIKKEADYEKFSAIAETLIIQNGVTAIGPSAFHGFTFSSIDIPSSVAVIGESAFRNCWKLSSVVLSDGITIIGSEAFSCCSSLSSVILPDTLTSIESGAFHDCPQLKTITIPKDVMNIEWVAFASFECSSSLSEIRFLGNIPNIGEDAFFGVAATAYYPCGNDTWLSNKLQNYGGKLYWQAMHIPSGSGIVTFPTCTEQGYTTYSCACGEKFVADFMAAKGHSFENGACTICGEKDPNFQPDGLKGDADGSGEVDYVDAMIVLQYHTGVIGEEDLDLAWCDVDGNGEVDYVDAMMILQYHTGVISGF